MEQLLNTLNDRQKQAVLYTGGPLMIVAGAGSGKTRVVTTKIAHLVTQGFVKPHKVTAVTFTNKAAGEMKERVVSMLSSAGMDYHTLNSITVSTFHSYCSRVLRGFIDRIGYNRDFVIYDSGDQEDLVGGLLDKHAIDKKNLSARDAVSIFNAIKNGRSGIKQGSELEKVYRDYEVELKKNNALDFNDLLKLAVDLFVKCPDVLEIFQDKAKFFFVDEYQDTNRIQYQLVKMLASKHRNICVVGDEDQSIYKWRGADINNILDFEKDYSDAKIIKLEENYRSTKNIISASSSLISKNFQRKDKNLFTNNIGGDKVKITSLSTDIDESNYIATEISTFINKKNIPAKNIAIFYRINAQSRLIEQSLRRSHIPYKIIGGIKFYDRKEIKDLICYLRVIINPHDTVSLMRMINTPARGIGKASIQKVNGYAQSKGISFYTAMESCARDPFMATLLNSATIKKFQDVLNLIVQLRELNAQGMHGSILLKTIIDKINYMDFIKENKSENADDRIENISEFLGAMADYEEEFENKSIAGFLESVALTGDSDIEEGSNDGVKLMTLHSAKGLEFPIVFVMGAETGLLPYIRYGDEDMDMEEERRLMYVGMTRAQKNLYITYACTRRVFGSVKARQVSQFICEIDEKFIEHNITEDKEDRSYDYEDVPMFTSYGSKTAKASTQKNFENAGIRIVSDEEDTQSKFIGAKVQHSTYGFGLIKDIEGSGDKAKVTVMFQRYGVKKLIWGYANLTVL